MFVVCVCYLLGVVGVVGHESGDVEHDLEVCKLGADTKLSRHVPLVVQATQKPLEPLCAYTLACGGGGGGGGGGRLEREGGRERKRGREVLKYIPQHSPQDAS